jgi:hypothetical protein
MVVLEQELGSFIGGHGNPRRNASRFMRRGFVGTPINFGDFRRGQKFRLHVEVRDCLQEGNM